MKKFKQLILASVAAIVIGVGGISATAQAQSDNGTVTVTEYSDYQCPACAYFHPIVEGLKDQFGDQIKVKLRHFPLDNHQFAALAARAAEAADNQGKFDEMHNLIFENQDRWSNTSDPTSIFVNYARDIGLDIEQFREDLNDAETQQIVMEQKEEGVDHGVNATPTFFIEGEKLEDLPRTYEEFEQVIQEYINRNQQG